MPPRPFETLTVARSGDWWVAALLFAAAAGVGSAYVRAFERTGVRTPADLRMLSAGTMWFGQSEFGAAVALACGHGFVDPGYALTPGLSAFLSLKADRFSCTELPAALAPRPPNLTQRLYRYLMWSTAAVWAVRGVSWSGLWPLFAVLYGATVVVCYGLFRFAMGRALACAAAVAVMVSAVHLGQLPGLRDYAKAPFILGLLLIAAHLATRVDRPRPLFALAALFGATLGVGFGFRNDIVIMLPVFLAALLMWDPPRDGRVIGLRLAALAAAAAAFAIAAGPILAAYARGSNSGHVALMGLMQPFEEPLGITGSVYEWGHFFRDDFANTLINSYTDRLYGHSVEYLSAEYDRAMIEYLLQIARHWPADILARAYGAAVTVVNLPFTSDANMAAVPHGIRTGTVLGFFDWQFRARSVLEGTGVAAVALALLVASRASAWRAVLLLATLLYLAGYPAIQFQPRHFFHLELVGWCAVGFLAQRAITGVARRARARRTGEPRPAVSWGPTRRMAAFAAIAIGIVALPLAAARLYQQRHLRTFLSAYVDAPREALPTHAVDSNGRTILRPLSLWTDRDPRRPIETRYIVAGFSPDACPAVRLPVTFRYAAVDERADYSLDTIVTLPRAAPPVEMFFPAYYVDGASRFDGVEVPSGLEGCVRQVSRVRNLASLPLLLHLTMTVGWERGPLYQRLTAWEGSGRPPFPPVYALPQTLPVTRATLHKNVISPDVLWRTPIVHDDSGPGWRITGTPPGPHWPVLQFAAQSRTPDDRFVLEGEVERGGITVGLVRGDRWTEGGTVTIETPGWFRAVLAPSTPGTYGVLFVNGLDRSWFLRHAPATVVQFAGRFHAFNDVRIAKAGWIQE